MSSSGSIKRAQDDEPNSKRPCDEIEDRLSSLPNELKTDIVSRLPIRQALKTSILSRGWKHTFSSLPRLAFFEHQFLSVPNSSRRLVELIDWTLANRDESELCTLAINFNIFEKPCLTLKSTWINFAVEHNVQYLHIIAQIEETGLPSSLFTCRTLTVFKFMARAQLLKLPSVIYLPNLKQMSLVNICFPNDILTEMLFAGCPLLLLLCIGKCGLDRLSRLTIPCPKLKILWISNCSGMDTCVINLQGTCLENIYYDGPLARNFEFGTVNRLSGVGFNITREPDDWRNDNELAEVAWNLLRDLIHVRELTLNVLFIKVLWEVRGELWQLRSFRNLTNVRLCVWPSVENEEIVMSLLGKFCHVQQLMVIIHRPIGFGHVLRMEMHPEKYNLDGVLKHLEHLEIDYFGGFELEMGFLKFFLGNAKSLTRVILRTPGMIVNSYGDDRFHHDDLNQETADELMRLSAAYPTVSMTVFDVNHTYN
ncbi:putative F-box/FBD/LRR-repeat protein At1g78760 [Silene latifolia]|uniref:putative F-box/FBD/LRR-repeat protein At1g78760 n=1 Tax=Silene latifolia TaxID=37657 RepID=UPI003D7802DE